MSKGYNRGISLYTNMNNQTNPNHSNMHNHSNHPNINNFNHNTQQSKHNNSNIKQNNPNINKSHNVSTITSTAATLPIHMQVGDDKKSLKKCKRFYKLTNPLPEIQQDTTSKALRYFLINLFTTRGKMKQSEAERFTGPNEMVRFMKIITHDSVNPNSQVDNYELYEHFGDTTVNKATLWYLKSRFPDLISRGKISVQIFSLQKALLVSKLYLARYSEKIGLSKLIRYRAIPYVTKKSDNSSNNETDNIYLDQSMKEDAYEALFGCIEEVIDEKIGRVGIGYSVAYSIISSILSEEYIPQTNKELKDYKSQLKELFEDRLRKYNQGHNVYSIKYIESADGNDLTLTLNFPGGDPSLLGPLHLNQSHSSFALIFGPRKLISLDGTRDGQKKAQEQLLSKDALDYLEYYYGERFIYKLEENTF